MSLMKRDLVKSEAFAREGLGLQSSPLRSTLATETRRAQGLPPTPEGAARWGSCGHLE